MDLGVTHCHKMRFQFLNRSIRPTFDLEDPLGLDDFPFVGTENKFPSLHAEKRRKLGVRSLEPAMFVG
jgi:hypothetical protein